MKKKISFLPNHPLYLGLYAAFGVFLIGFAKIARLSPDIVFLSLGFLVTVVLFNRYFFRLDVDDKTVSGPGRFGPMHRVSIPLSDAECHFGVKKGALRFTIIKNTKTSHQTIKIAEANFGKERLRELQEMLMRHCKSAV